MIHLINSLFTLRQGWIKAQADKTIVLGFKVSCLKKFNINTLL